jgi:hypothetical protein
VEVSPPQAWRWKPATEAQRKALECDADVLLFGGAAGSLKSEYLLVDQAQEYDHPRLRGILFRRTFPELSQLINRSRELYSNQGFTYNETSHTWNAPWGASMKFAYCKRDEEAYLHQGQEYSWIGWDESTHHSEFQIRYLLSRLRSTDMSIWQRCRLATNPGGEGHGWHQHMFLGGVCPHCMPAIRVPDVIYKDAIWHSDKAPLGMTTCFIFGRVKDHDLLGKAYEQRLAMQSGATAKALLEGCWQAFEGQYFDLWEPNRPENPMIVKRQEIGDKPWWPHWVGADYGFSGSQAAAYLFASDPAGKIWCLQEYCAKGEEVRSWSREVARRFACIVHTEDETPRHINVMYLSPDSWNDRGDHNTLADQMNEELKRYGLAWDKARNDRAGGAMLIYTYLKTGKLAIADTCDQLQESLRTRLHDPDEPEKVLKVIGDPLDDCYDGFRYGVYSYQPPAEKPTAVRMAEAMQGVDPTVAMIRRGKIMKEIEQDNQPIYLSHNARRLQGMRGRGR